MKRGRLILFLIYLVLGAYLINLAAGFFEIPDLELFVNINDWVFLLGGIFLIWSGITLFKRRTYK